MGTTTDPEQFYDYFERRYRSDRLPGPTDLATRENRHVILGVLLNNIMEADHPIAHLYALLLARTYCQSDPEMMKRYGEEVAKYVHDGPLRDEEEADEPPRRRRRRAA
jgi:hypothetical protein